jgi:hypothetical protein
MYSSYNEQLLMSTLHSGQLLQCTVAAVNSYYSEELLQ